MRRLKTRYPNRRGGVSNSKVASRAAVHRHKRETPSVKHATDKAVTVCGKQYPGCHPGFLPYLEELFFHTSRYYGYAERFIRQLSGQHSFSMYGFSASGMSEEQRRVMAGLLSHPPSKRVAEGVIGLVEAVNSCEHNISRFTRQFYIPKVELFQDQTPTHQVRQKTHQKCNDMPIEQLLHFAERLNVRVDLCGGDIKLPLQQLERTLNAMNPTVRSVFSQILMGLRLAGYRIYERDEHPEPKYQWN